MHYHIKIKLMKKRIIFGFIILVSLACQNNKKEPESKNENKELSQKELTILHEVANAYGYKNWPDVEQVKFSFVVNPGEDEMSRQWTWHPKTNKVTLTKGNEMITYDKNNVMDEFKKTDKAFVNDSFWLLFPFHLVWDDIDYEVEDAVLSPINQEKAQKLIVKYPKDGGYTPGDKYEVYLDENHHIIEWSYHPGGQKKPALTNTFDELTDFNGIKINMSHSSADGGFQLIFRDVSVN